MARRRDATFQAPCSQEQNHGTSIHPKQPLETAILPPRYSAILPCVFLATDLRPAAVVLQ